MNGKKAKAQRKSNGDRGQGYLRRLRKQDKTARQTQDSTSTTPAVPVQGQASKATGPKTYASHDQPNYGPVIDTRPMYNAKATARMALATTAEPPLHWFDKTKALLNMQGLAQRISKSELMRKLNTLRLI